MAADFNHPPRPLKPIKLPKFNSLMYTAWAFQCRSLLELANVWNIVTGDEPQPAPLAAGTANARATQQARIDYWNSRDQGWERAERAEWGVAATSARAHELLLGL